MTRRTKRIFYGPDTNPMACWWDVEWSNAKKSVKVNGTLEHAIEGKAGHSIGCRLSNATQDVNNASAFPHPVYIAAFYKHLALIVDRLAKNGTPNHAIVYEHSYGDYVDLNDMSNLEAVYKDKSFVLRAPSTKKKTPKKTVDQKQEEDEGRELERYEVDSPASPINSVVAQPEEFSLSAPPKKGGTFKGAMGRAVKAGILGRPAADQLTRAIRRVHDK